VIYRTQCGERRPHVPHQEFVGEPSYEERYCAGVDLYPWSAPVGAFDGVQGLMCGAVSDDGVFECDFNLEHSGTHTWEREGIRLKRVERPR
jgi:hypothetical protein